MEKSINRRVDPGTVVDITQRLLLLARRSGNGLSLVSYSSDVVRTEVLRRLRLKLSEQAISFQEILLPTYQDPTVLSDYLLNELEKSEANVISISGFLNAFREAVPIEDSLRIINLSRERIACLPTKQIWWMDEKFLNKAFFAMPDLISWFMPQLRLTEKSRGFDLGGNSTANKISDESGSFDIISNDGHAGHTLRSNDSMSFSNMAVIGTRNIVMGDNNIVIGDNNVVITVKGNDDFPATGVTSQTIILPEAKPKKTGSRIPFNLNNLPPGSTTFVGRGEI